MALGDRRFSETMGMVEEVPRAERLLWNMVGPVLLLLKEGSKMWMWGLWWFGVSIGGEAAADSA